MQAETAGKLEEYTILSLYCQKLKGRVIQQECI